MSFSYLFLSSFVHIIMKQSSWTAERCLCFHVPDQIIEICLRCGPRRNPNECLIMRTSHCAPTWLNNLHICRSAASNKLNPMLNLLRRRTELVERCRAACSHVVSEGTHVTNCRWFKPRQTSPLSIFSDFSLLMSDLMIICGKPLQEKEIRQSNWDGLLSVSWY